MKDCEHTLNNPTNEIRGLATGPKTIVSLVTEYSQRRTNRSPKNV
jgi:hypothetical protein